MRASWVVVLVAFGACTAECKQGDHPCYPGTNDHRPCPAYLDAELDTNTDEGYCNILTQTGCNVGERCDWFIDQIDPPLGHISCAPEGVAVTGSACVYGPPGPQGYDDCMRGDVCANGTCAKICDPLGGNPMCGPSLGCRSVEDLFEVGGMYAAGACAPTCDPLADNDALGSGTRAGSACGSGEGCYLRTTAPVPAQYVCMAELNPTLTHRSACTAANGCATVVNGCAQGYVSLVDQQTGSSTAICVAFCTPADCWLGNCPNDQLRGVPPHDCTPASARGTFAVASAGGSNGDQCVYSWSLELDSSGHYLSSPTGNSVGICIDHSQFRYDSNGNGTIDGSDAVLPRCDTLDIASGFDAAYFGCVSTTTATAHGHPPESITR